MQLNTRLDPVTRQAVEVVCDTAGFSQREFVEIAIGTLFGTTDKILLAKREKAVEVFAAKGLKLPFEHPMSCLS